MTFKILAKGLLVGGLVFLSTQSALATTQVISCENDMSVVLFGLRGAYGEVFSSGLADLSSDGSSATITARNRPDENYRSDTLFAGSDYNGNSVVVNLPRAVIGRVVILPFKASAKTLANNAAKEKTIDLTCVSQITQ